MRSEIVGTFNEPDLCGENMPRAVVRVASSVSASKKSTFSLSGTRKI